MSLHFLPQGVQEQNLQRISGIDALVVTQHTVSKHRRKLKVLIPTSGPTSSFLHPSIRLFPGRSCTASFAPAQQCSNSYEVRATWTHPQAQPSYGTRSTRPLRLRTTGGQVY